MTDFSPRFSLQRPYNRESEETSPERFNLRACGIEALEDKLESDRGRIINSAAVRRLQQKTQVFPLERNAAVRSRLTHSLEVQQTGRFITRTIFRRLGDEAHKFGLQGLDRASETLVEMACLMHDIGNPPFGHFGEAALSRWFAEHIEQFLPFAALGDNDSLAARLRRELESFEGNAQAIRLISNLQTLNLTYVQAATVLKYTRPATQSRPPAGSPLAYLQKKPGYYHSEAGFVASLWQALGIEPGHRHPLTYVMEAADDISYCLADLEDGVDKGLMTYQQLAALLRDTFARLRPEDHGLQVFRSGGGQTRSFAEIIDHALARAAEEPVNSEYQFFVWLRVGLVHPLVDHAAGAFLGNLEAVHRGDLDRALLEDHSPAHGVIETFKKVAMEHVFCVPEVETLELQGYRIITGLLDHYLPLLLLSQDDFTRLLAGDRKGLLVESRLYKRLPKKHVKAYQTLLGQGPFEEDRQDLPQGLWERYCRCRLIQDMVSGMTDQFALDEFQALSVTSKLG